jgi:hypothetical protein
MQSEEFDKKVKEAADHHHPAYDEKAWEKMEKLLDKHLPQKKDDRRRIIFFLFLFLLVGGGLFLMISKPWQQNRPVAGAGKNNPLDVPVITTKDAKVSNLEKIEPANTPVEDRIAIQETKTEKKKMQTTRLYNDKTTPVIAPETMGGKNKQEKNINDFSSTGNDNVIVKTDPVKNDFVLKNEAVANNRPVNNDLAIGPKTVENTAEQKLNLNTVTDTLQKAADATIKQPAKKIRFNNKKANSFFLSLSAGPDISFAGLEDLGKTKLLTGAGIGYTFKNKFTIRAGFYTSRKIYTATSYQYHSPTSIWISNYKLESVDADCKVYEIPLLLSYNFSRSLTRGWFVTTGVSSYLMKRETYDYQYKNSAGQVYTHQWTLKDKNKHYFSVLTLAGGYKRNINNTFSITAEPYMKIPFNGVGYGKVRLNSAGVLLSVNIKPFGSGKAKSRN